MTNSGRALTIFLIVAIVRIFQPSDAKCIEIHDTVRDQDLEAVRKLLKDDPELVKSRINSGRTPLHLAAQGGNIDMVQLLMAHGADVNALDRKAYLPVSLVGNPEVVRILIKAATDANANLQTRQLIQRIADESRNNELVDVLVESGYVLTFGQRIRLGRTSEVAEMLQQRPELVKEWQKCLHDAAFEGHLEIVKLLLKHGADPNSNPPVINQTTRYTPLTSAIVSGHYEIAEVLCNAGAETSVSGNRAYRSLLHQVVTCRTARYLKLMLDHGADPNLQLTLDLWPGKVAVFPVQPHLTALHVAACIGSIEKCRLLLEHRADVNARTHDGFTALDFAAIEDRRDVCELLLNHNATLSFQTACALGKLDEVKRMLLSDPELASRQDTRLHRRPIFWAAASGHGDIVQLLIDSGAGVNVRALSYSNHERPLIGPVVNDAPKTNTSKITGETPLHVAASGGHTDVVKRLVENGARIDVLDQNRQTPLYRAADAGRVGTVKLLLEHGAKIEVEGQSCLFSASDNPEIMELFLKRQPSQSAMDQALEFTADRNQDVARLLIKQGATPDILAASALGLNDRLLGLLVEDPLLATFRESTLSQRIPINLAAENGHVDTVSLLMERGAGIRLGVNVFPLQKASANGHIAVMEFLVANGADVNQKDDEVMTPLQWAARGGHAKAIAWLLAHGAKTNARDSEGFTALHHAAWADNADAVQALISGGVAIDGRNDLWNTPLHTAAEFGSDNAAMVLLKAGADINSRNRSGLTSLSLAEVTSEETDPQTLFLHPGNDRPAVAKRLRDHGGTK